jgi:ATP-dependent helicase/nuclease subunit A
MTNGGVAMAKHRILPTLPKLRGEQAVASSPTEQIRLSASAGTGKTQVLSARVLRLLLSGVKPESILCLTFTKAGAAEMADRIHERLGAWVTMAGGLLAKDLDHLGETIGPEGRENARSLFAKVLDARGSGLRIQTIHSFCQTLLASFPAEAGLPLGFRPVEGREEEQLAAKALADMVEGFTREGRLGDLDRLKATAKRLSEKTTRSFLRRCAAHADVMEAIGSGVAARVRAWLGLHEVDVETIVRAGCIDGGFDAAGLAQIRQLNIEWGTVSGLKKVDAINRWTVMTVEDRMANLALIHSVWAKKDGDPLSTVKGQAPQDPAYPDLVAAQFLHFSGLIDMRRLAATAEAISDALLVGQAYARAYTDAKRAAGVVDFNDLIRSTVGLLKTEGIGEWIKFKLDQSVDHILVDEAQDTNADQWNIVKALAGEFFYGAGAKGDAVRTIFAVGDFKQAIFGFQGTDPNEFNEATDYFEALAEGAGRPLQKLSLNQSFRSSQPILDATDAVIAGLGHEALGLPGAPDSHRSAKGGSGSVTLLAPITEASADEVELDTDDADEDAEEGWIGAAELKWASLLAKRIKHWTKGGLYLRNEDRGVEPGDVMILVRSRGDLARLIISRLYEEGVPVAGIDRLQLGAPIAVQDLLACIRFALQPRDDLSLACLLVSPLIGWSQDELYTHAKGRSGALWPHLRETLDEADLAVPYALLGMADLSTPYQFLETILSGPIAGRRKLIARLGEEARDPIEELLNAALAFEEQAMPSLQLFLDWFDRGDVEIKRDPGKPENAVRVMTVHGAKGLQAPVVVLADATSDPDYKKSSELNWQPEDDLPIPLFRPKAADRVGSLQSSAEVQDKREREEHWRLLYVAMTRAEEHLFVGGALKPKQIKNGMGPGCWHRQIGQALENIGAQTLDDTRVYALEEPPRSKPKRDDAIEFWTGAMPDWAIGAARPEARPPRPLAPSAIEVIDDEASPPPSEEMRRAARRGVLLHSLFERLPGVVPTERAAVAARWLEHSAGVSDPAERDELVAAALAVITNSDFEAFFSPEALAEAPLAGVVAGRVIAGTVDRLIVTDTDVLVVDFKTGRRVPGSADTVSRHHKAQMAAYAAVLADVFPDRKVRAALLYTSGPKLITLSPEIIAAHKPGFTDEQQVLAD